MIKQVHGMSMSATLLAGLSLLECVGGQAALAQTCEVHPIQRLAPSNLTFSDEFGTSVAMSGDVAIIGAPGRHVDDSHIGSAYIYRRNGQAWAQEQEIVSTLAASEFSFGTTVAVAGNTVVIGSPLNPEFGEESGAVHVFQFDGAHWVETQELHTPAPGPHQRFGAALVMNEQSIVVGAPLDGNGLGSVHIFEREGKLWQERQMLVPPPDPHDMASFGYALSMSGDLLAIGAPRRTGQAYACGGTYLFRSHQGEWGLEATLEPSQPQQNGWMGFVVACEGSTVVAGAYAWPGLIPPDVYQVIDSNWIFVQRLIGVSNEYSNSWACAIRDGAIFVSSPRGEASHAMGNFPGVVRRFVKMKGVWTSDRLMFTSVADQEAGFGTSLATDGEVLMAGAPSEQPNQVYDMGGAYIVPISQPDCNGNGLLDDCELQDCNGNRTPDTCDIASGASSDCNLNGIPDECEAATMYRLDGGTGTDVYGVLATADYLWLNHFTVQPGGELITEVEIAWSIYSWEHIPATVVLYRDPNNDGDPTDAILLQTAPTETRLAADNSDLNFQRVRVPRTFVGFPGESFFVGVFVQQPFFMPLAAADSTPPVITNWWKAEYPGNLNLHDLSAGQYPLHAVQRNWIVRAIANDCNANGIADACDIEDGASADANANGIPDECEAACPPDLASSSGLGTGDGVVDMDDLVALITHWGRAGGAADLNHDGAVNIDDLVLLITHWGPCG